MNLQSIKTLNLLIRLTGALLYALVSLAILRVIAPALISSPSDELVIVGMALVAIWLIASITLVYHLYIKHRRQAATTPEKDQ